MMEQTEDGGIHLGLMSKDLTKMERGSTLNFSDDSHSGFVKNPSS